MKWERRWRVIEGSEMVLMVLMIFLSEYYPRNGVDQRRMRMAAAMAATRRPGPHGHCFKVCSR